MIISVFLARGLAAVTGAVALFGAADAMADRRHHGHYYGSSHYYGHYDPYYRGHWHRHPRARGPVVILRPGYPAPPPPRVVYVPVPAAQPPLQAVPASPVYQSGDGRYCREYQTTITVEGRPQPSYGTACLGPDGAWRIVD